MVQTGNRLTHHPAGNASGSGTLGTRHCVAGCRFSKTALIAKIPPFTLRRFCPHPRSPHEDQPISSCNAAGPIVRAILRKHSLPFEDIDIINNRANYAEMVQKSGQPLSPCVEIDGVMLADISGEEVENYLLGNDLVKPTEIAADVATNAGCSDDEHAKLATKTIRFF